MLNKERRIINTRNPSSGILGLIVGAGLVGIALSVWLVSVGNPMTYWTQPVPPGQKLYVLSKLAGLLCFCFLWLQCIFGLSKRAALLKSFPTLGTRGHIWLGMLTTILAALHLCLFFLAVSARTGSVAWGLLIPDFGNGYYQLHLGLGLVAFWLMILGMFAGWRTTQGHARWRKVHMVWTVVFALGFWHAFAIGTESRFGAMRYVWLFLGIGVLTAALSRVGAGSWVVGHLCRLFGRPEPRLEGESE